MTTFDPDIGKSTRWRKGASGNPGVAQRSLLSQALAVTLAEVVLNDPQERTYAQLVADTLVGIATTPGRLSVAAAAEIANRVEGRVHERIEFTDLTEQLSMRSDEELRYFLKLM